MKTLYLVDVSSMFFRAFFAIRSLTNSRGMPTNAIYGFLSMVTKLLRERNPEYIAFCYDRPEPSFREKIDPNYKANRDEAPDDLIPQIPYIHKIADILGVCSLEKEGYEADDLIGSLARMAEAQGMDVVIVSGDKDFSQLIGPKIQMYDTMKEAQIDEAAVIARWGVKPSQFVDFLALVGDSSDNVPGVKQVGPKSAAKLLQQFGSLDDIYARLAEVTPQGLAKKLEVGHEDALRSRRLVAIVDNLDLGLGLEDLSRKPLQKQALRDLLNELEFRSMERFFVDQAAVESAPSIVARESVKVEMAESANSQSQQITLSVVAAASAAVDGYTEMEITMADFRRRLQPNDEIWAIPFGGGITLVHNKAICRVREMPDQVGAFLQDIRLQWKGCDLKQLWHAMNLTSASAAWDHKIAAYLLRPGAVGDFNELCESHLSETHQSLGSMMVALDQNLRLEQILRQKLDEQNGAKILNEIELPLAGVLYQMERQGIQVDAGILHRQSQKLTEDIAELEASIFRQSGQTFNISSPKQLGFILFEKMGMPKGRKTKTGYSTDNDVLVGLSSSYEICRDILQYRELVKLKSTYVEPLPQMLDKSGRVHTTFNQTLTATGRLSSVNPNLQNIPTRTERGNAIREAFIASPGCQLLGGDYSQIELRILAHITGDPGLCGAFEDNRDVHTATASLVFDRPPSEVTDDLRRMAKAVNFGIAYGQGAFGLAESLHISRTEADEIIKQYFLRFPRVREYIHETIEQAKQKRFVESMFGRRRYIDELRSSRAAVRKFGERAAINAPMQSTASDIVKLAMVKAQEQIKAPMLLQVHDELIFEVPASELEATADKLKQVMESIVKLRVPLKVNLASGINWLSIS